MAGQRCLVPVALGLYELMDEVCAINYSFTDVWIIYGCKSCYALKSYDYYLAAA
jgi:hypothetical protein